MRRRGLADVAVLRADRDRPLEGRPRTNLLDGGAHFYGTYECKDGEFISLGSIEPQFYAELRRLAGLDDALYDGQMDAKNWPAMKEKMTEVFKSQDPRRVVRDHGRHRRLLRPGAVAVGSAGSSAHGGAQDFRRRRRRGAARARAALFAHALGDQEDGGGGAGEVAKEWGGR